MIKKNFQDMALGVLLALLLFVVSAQAVSFYQQWTTLQNDREPIRNWVELTQLQVPDFKEGENPPILFDRTYHQTFKLDYGNSIQQVVKDGVSTICSNSGSNFTVSPDLRLPLEGATLNWLMTKDCHLGPGQYRVTMDWIIRRDGYSDREVSIVSNIFEVTNASGNVVISN